MTDKTKQEELRTDIEEVLNRYDARLNGLDANTANYIKGVGNGSYVDKMIDLINSEVLSALEKVKKISGSQKSINSQIHGINACKSCSLMERIDAVIEAIEREYKS